MNIATFLEQHFYRKPQVTASGYGKLLENELTSSNKPIGWFQSDENTDIKWVK